MRTKHKKEYCAVLSMACMMVAVLCSCTKGNSRQYGTTTTPATPGVPALLPKLHQRIPRAWRFLHHRAICRFCRPLSGANRRTIKSRQRCCFSHTIHCGYRLDYHRPAGSYQYRNPQGPFAAVSLLIGVNDQFQQRDTTGYRGRFTTLLNTAVSLAGNHKNHVFVLSIPDYGVTPFGAGYYGISEQVDAFNAINKEVTDAYGIDYIDVTIISRNDAGNAAMLAPDGLHPSGSQYAQWAAALAPVMEKRLK